MTLKKASSHKSVKSMLETLQARADEAKGKRATATTAEASTKPASGDDIKQQRNPPQKSRGVSAARLIERAQLQLFNGEQRGDFKQHPIEARSEYPSVLTRIPLFLPTQRSRARAELDDNLSLPFETSWGKGRKFGPPLTIYDEDTLLALLGLRQKQLVGKSSRLPVKVGNPCGPNDETNVHVVYTTVGALDEFLECSKGGRGYKKRLESVKRLAAVVIEFTRISDPKINAVVKQQTFSTKLLDLVTQEMDQESCLYVQFPPVMVKWLEESYTYIEMDIRRKLTGHGKAIHKFLASQPRFNISVQKLRTITGTSCDTKEFMRLLRQTMTKLSQLGWCEYEIQGTGRKVPYKLVGYRLKKKG